MSNLKRVSTHTPIDEIISILEDDGCIVIEGALGKEDLLSLKNELEPQFAQVPACSGDFYGYKTKRMSSLIVKSKICRKMAIDETILQIMDAFLLKNCSDYQLNLTQAISIGPGEPSQIIHRDDLMFPYPHAGSEWMINCMWAVDDFTKENGGTNLVVGSHKWDPEKTPEEGQIIQAEMKAGSVLLYMASLLHGGGENSTSKSRTGIVLSYCLGWLRQAENQYLSTPLALAQTFPERLQRLIGYFAHKPNLGCVEGKDPILLLKGENLSNGKFEEFISDEAKEFLREHRAGLRRAV